MPKIKKGLELREAVNGRAPWIKLLPPTPPTVWFHCASGEFEYAKPVIALIKKELPQLKIVVTYFSPTYVDQIRKFAGVDWVVPLPWDTPWPLSQFLSSYRPFALLAARTDVWPEMARQARVRHLRSVLFSATLTPDSGRTRGVGRWATRATLNQLDDIFCVSELDAKEFRAIGLNRTQITQAGDTRYDQVIRRLETPKPVRDDLFESIGQRDLFVCGSTWSQDEDVLIAALSEMKMSVCGVVVPHEPTPRHMAALELALRAHGLTMVRYSDPEASLKMQAASTCLVVDQTGILAELYLKARWAFVGGSFRKTVHSVMEPLAAGCLTFVGPLHTNNREAVSFQKLELSRDLSFVTVVQTSQELVQKIKEAQTLPESKTQISAAVRERSGSSQLLIDWLRRDL
jgi:3-deoxy-D-manno-octulosonic-acid transferase